MDDTLEMLKLNPALDATALADQFRDRQHIQVIDLLDEQAAVDLARMLMERTPWGVSWQAGTDGPHRLRHDQMAALTPQQMHEMTGKLNAAMSGEDFAFVYSQY